MVCFEPVSADLVHSGLLPLFLGPGKSRTTWRRAWGGEHGKESKLLASCWKQEKEGEEAIDLGISSKGKSSMT